MKKLASLTVILILISSYMFLPKVQLDIQGHRGARGLMPENTLPAFEKALALGVNTLELDVVISKDFQVVVSHEPYFSPEICTDKNGNPFVEKNALSNNLFNLTYQEIKEVDCGSKPHPRFPKQTKLKTYKPLLKDVIRMAEKYCAEHHLPKISYNIEIKSTIEEEGIFQPDVATFSDLVYNELKNEGVLERSNLQSFDVRVLQYLHQQYAEVVLAFLVENELSYEENLQLLGFIPNIYSPYYQFLEKNIVDDLHKKGIRVIPWTINKEEEMLQLVEMGVDGIITDYPDLAIGLLRK